MGDPNIKNNKKLIPIEDEEAESRKAAIRFVDENFAVTETVNHLQYCMKEVTKKELTADTVNAACNCVQNLNLTIKTAIQAAKFIKNQR